MGWGDDAASAFKLHYLSRELKTSFHLLLSSETQRRAKNSFFFLHIYRVYFEKPLIKRKDIETTSR